MTPPFTVSLGAATTDRDVAGGKGAALGRMVAAALPVPTGFVVTTAAYRRFVVVANLAPVIAETVAEVDAADSEALEAAAATIRAAFEAAAVPEDVAEEIVAAYHEFDDGGGRVAQGDLQRADGMETAVAVRSSATAEDLPGLSFAGQHQTLLNVRGEAAAVAAVRLCWASLWSARAIGYRRRMGVDDEGVAMAVVVQRLVPAEVAGVLFTVDPAGGDRERLVVNASYGLGEAIVGGEVTPDAYVLSRARLVVKDVTIGAKVRAVVSESDAAATAYGMGGVRRIGVDPARAAVRALDDGSLKKLGELGLRVEALFNDVPQDIEWAFHQGRFWLLQARPITGLPEAGGAEIESSAWESPILGAAWIRRQVVEHMPEPLSPLFAELYLRHGLERSMDVWMEEFGLDPRLIDRLVKRPIFDTINGFAYMRVDIEVGLGIVPTAISIYVRALPKLLRRGIAQWRDEAVPNYHATIARWRAIDTDTAPDATLLKGVRALSEADAAYWFAASMPIGMAKISDGLLARALGWVRGGEPISGAAMLRGFDSPALDAQASLEEVARRISADETLATRLLDAPADRLGQELKDAEGDAAESARTQLAAHFERHGHSFYSLDFAAPTQVEEPLPVYLGLQELIAHPERDVRSLQREHAAARDRLAAEAVQRVGPLRRPLFRRILRWAQRSTPMREEALFHVAAAWPVLRRLALDMGHRLVAAGTLEEADDVFYLEPAEIEVAVAVIEAGTKRMDLRAVARERRDERRAQAGLSPPAMVPEDYRFHIGPFSLSLFETQQRNVEEGAILRGFAISPGRVTAPASLIRNRADFARMRPGTILVCPTTTPAWTPLFARASGLVTDIGGVLAHGSIVAREYGIPAVMGVGAATERIRHGQLIIVDGTAGTVEILDDAASTVEIGRRNFNRRPIRGADSTPYGDTPAVFVKAEDRWS